MRAELDAVRFDFANLRQAEDLESAAVGQDWMRPVDEFVQPAGVANDVKTRADVKVIRVAENDFGAHLDQFARVERLDAALSADGHEHRRVNDATRSGQSSQPRFGTGIGFQQFEHAG